MPLLVNKNAASGSGNKSSTSSAADEPDVSALPERLPSLDPSSEDTPTASSVYATSTSSSDGSASIANNSPESVVAVTSGGITFNLTFDSFAPSSFRAGIQQAASILTAAISDQITVNLSIHYSGTGGGAFASQIPGLYESYSATTAALINQASLGDTIFNALPGGSSIQGQSLVAVWNAQLKALGFLSANASGNDGSATFSTDINPNLLVGVALHELTHALGRVPYGPQPDVFDLFRFTSSGSRLFTGSTTSAVPAYFSVDGGVTRLADYGRTSDSSDFLNSGVQGSNDAFNEFYTSSTTQQLSNVDLLQLDALGFHLVSNTPVAIDGSGSTFLYRAPANNTYYMLPAGGTTGPQVKYNGAPVAQGGRFGAWTAIGAEAISGGYEIAWKFPGADQFSVWNTDGVGNMVSNPTGVVSGLSSTLELLESTFHQDLNSDGVIGPVTTTIETSGSITLLQVGNNYLFAGLSGPQVKFSGAPVTVGQFGAWVPIGAEATPSGYEIAWRVLGADQFSVWNTDSNGDMISNPTGVASGYSATLELLESSFNQDFNGDGMIGPVTTTIETSGSTTLLQVGSNYLFAGLSGPQVKFSGAPVTLGQFGAWVPIGAEATPSGYEIAWRVPGADQYSVWTTDGSGNMISNPTGVVSGSSLALQSFESSFQQDLNGDGTTGPVTTVIEALGSTSLVQVADTYSLYPVGGSSGPQLKFNGAAVTVGLFGAWAPIGGEITASGYEVAWKMGADQYSVWTTDGSGNMISNPTGVVSGSSLALQSFESSFQQDLNGDGTIGAVGATAPMTTQTGGTGDGSGSVNLSLLTNYLASTFVQPSGDAGPVVQAHTTDQGFLVKPS